MNIKINSREADSEDKDWNQLAHYGVQWRAFDISEFYDHSKSVDPYVS
jgi:hypothetical protein